MMVSTAELFRLRLFYIRVKKVNSGGLTLWLVAFAFPELPVRGILGRLERTGIGGRVDVAPAQTVVDLRPAGIALQHLLYRQPSLDIFFRFIVENVLAAVRTKVEGVAGVGAFAVRY